MEEILENLDENKKQKIDEIIKYFNEVSVKTEVCFLFDEDIEESELALQKIEEAKFWAIKSVIKKGW